MASETETHEDYLLKVHNELKSSKFLIKSAETDCCDLCLARDVFLITWNPKPRFYNYDHLGENDYNLQWETMLKVLMKVSRCSSIFCIIPEVSDQGKLHCHGWFNRTDKRKYYKSFLPSLKRNGLVKINKCRTLSEDVFKYYKKDVDNTFDLLTDFNYPILSHDTVHSLKHDIAQRRLDRLFELKEEASHKMDIIQTLYRHGYLKKQIEDVIEV